MTTWLGESRIICDYLVERGGTAVDSLVGRGGTAVDYLACGEKKQLLTTWLGESRIICDYLVGEEENQMLTTLLVQRKISC